MKPTLGQVFTASLLGLCGILACLFFVVFHTSQKTIVESSERLRNAAGREIGERVTGFLAQAPAAVLHFQETFRRDNLDPRDRPALERAVLAPLLASPDLGELTLTYGTKTGFTEKGDVLLAPQGRGQLSVWRGAGEEADRIFSQVVRESADGTFAEERRTLGTAGQPLSTVIPGPEANVPDPTEHLTFTTPASAEWDGRPVWSDLHWSQVDADLPEARRRVEVSVQQSITDGAGHFAGVLRVGLLKQQLDRAVELRLAAPRQNDPHLIFLCDTEGRLITRGGHPDLLQDSGIDLRVPAAGLPEPIALALGDEKLRAGGSGHFRFHGEEFLTTFRPLRGTQGWMVGIVVPRSFYLGRLAAMRERLLLLSLGIIGLLIAGGFLLLRSVRRAHAQIARESGRMDSFEFSPAPTAAPFRDVSEVLESLEKAKTAMRAMGRYVPIDLVRKLYREKSEPELGGEEIDVSLMFTDIQDFTRYSEELAPDRLAAALGLYLKTMAAIIQRETSGTIDKYIGDAIMTLWNAPEPVADHPVMACRAALLCREAGRALARSPEWEGLPPFVTRFGLHRDTALVGHFGAPDRLNYTAIGDAVNLASRLEGLNKVYGTTIVASETIVAAAGERFAFRLLDVVAVKGKARAVKIYELLGEKGLPCPACAGEYERAFAAYLARDFRAAIAILEGHRDDPPGAVLLERCRRRLAEPPPADWNGVHIATEK